MTISIEQSALTSICPDPVIAVNDAGIITLFNPAAEKLLGYSAQEAVGKLHISVVYPDETIARKIVKLMVSGAQGGVGRLEGFETFIQTLAGEQVPIRLSASLIGGRGERKGSIGFFHDMSQQKLLEANLKRQSITDDLSGLFNQRHFFSQVAREMARAKRYGAELGLVCIDLDGFKLANDRMGHLKGDQIIRTIGALLKSGLRESDQAFRYGGDEFMLLLPNTGREHAVQLANRIQGMFNSACEYSPEFNNDNGIVISMSIGISTGFGDEPVDYFVQRADMAMYQAKQDGGDCVRFFVQEQKAG